MNSLTNMIPPRVDPSFPLPDYSTIAPPAVGGKEPQGKGQISQAVKK
jgi:hypothetical protein